ncbi:sigma-70 family RNA polymerase sigma factor [Aureibaculum sp. 2210JD6-5]|uniref:RNA polymerase sigma factor n=1 Tax=Aureibaculum sp. 2210JD6-5 TaxID=3103957 RepID=UPI002AAD0D53|nr:sigma-70 family RNA polymerase sigma factor [Aureibaculum sp. 2210JD6-5]MDY7394651.1 sigma-70 family RNA polymerase sigma factor [Aureibaculum sp. 2210JD6-5]
MSLKELINSCKQNDIKAQSQIYQLYAGKLFGLCLKYSKNYQEAQDNLHEGFITIFNKIEQYQFKGSFEGWLKRIIINTALQTYRKKNVLSLVNEEIPDVEVEVEIEDDEISLDFLLKLIQELPERYQMVFNLYVLDGYPHKEIAKMLNISEGTSKSNLSRARVILRNKIEADQLNKNEAL